MECLDGDIQVQKNREKCGENTEISVFAESGRSGINVVDPDTFNKEFILTLLLSIIILLIPLALHIKLPFPTAFKFTFPVPLVDIFIDLFGNNGSNCGKNDTPYIFCCPNICPKNMNYQRHLNYSN